MMSSQKSLTISFGMKDKLIERIKTAKTRPCFATTNNYFIETLQNSPQ